MEGADGAAVADERLIGYLQTIRRGLGLARPDLLPNIPNHLLELLNLDTALSSERQVEQFFVLISRELDRLDKTDRLTAAYARLGLNLSGDTRKWLARAQAQADRDGESRKTVERRVNAALKLLAVRLAARSAPEEASVKEKVALARLKKILDRRDELEVSRFDVTIRVFAAHVEVHEVVEVVSHDPAAQFYVVGKTLPYRSSRVTTTVLEGARLLDAEQPNPHWLLELLELPEPIPTAESHRFAVLHITRGMAPMWTTSSHHRMESLTLRVWYADCKARPTWLIDEFPPDLLRGEDIGPILEAHAQPLDVDRLGNASHAFAHLRRERSYGIAWTNPGKEA